MVQAEEKDEIQSIIQKYPNVFKGVGKLKDHLVKLHVDTSIKPVAEPARTVPYHLQERVEEVLKEMIVNDIIEEHPVGEPAPWTSNMVIAPKADGDIRLTLDARNVNKAIQSCNAPIPKHKDIIAKFGNAKFFSKLAPRIKIPSCFSCLQQALSTEESVDGSEISTRRVECCFIPPVCKN